jgi:hypothetical protein
VWGKWLIQPLSHFGKYVHHIEALQAKQGQGYQGQGYPWSDGGPPATHLLGIVGLCGVLLFATIEERRKKCLHVVKISLHISGLF